MTGTFLSFVLLLAATSTVQAALLNVTLTRVVDGDSVVVQNAENEKIRVRMRYIDAPETSQKNGPEATQFLKDVIGEPGQAVQLDAYKNDRYGRVIGILHSMGENVNKMMVDNGYAWCYRNRCPEEYKFGVEASKEEKIGLFKDPNPVTPWDYRKSKKKKKPVVQLSTDQIIANIPVKPSLTRNALRVEVTLVSVSDGDTIKVLSKEDNITTKVRFLFIDSPEKSQAAGKDAKDYLKNLLTGSTKKLVIRVQGEDRYGRTLGVIQLGRRDVNKLMVANGYAWCYKTGCPRSYKAAMRRARRQKIGLWEASNPQAPWDYRKYGARKNN